MVSSTLSYDNLSRSEKILLQNGIRPIFKNKVTASISQKTNQDKNSTSFKLNDQSDTSGVNVALSITVQEKEKMLRALFWIRKPWHSHRWMRLFP